MGRKRESSTASAQMRCEYRGGTEAGCASCHIGSSMCPLPFHWLFIQHQYNTLGAKLLNKLPIRLAVSWTDQQLREADTRFSSLEPITQVNYHPQYSLEDWRGKDRLSCHRQARARITGAGNGSPGGLAAQVLLKLPEQEESLPGKDLKDLALPGAKGKEMMVVGCCVETELFRSLVLIS